MPDGSRSDSGQDVCVCVRVWWGGGVLGPGPLWRCRGLFSSGRISSAIPRGQEQDEHAQRLQIERLVSRPYIPPGKRARLQAMFEGPAQSIVVSVNLGRSSVRLLDACLCFVGCGRFFRHVEFAKS